MGIRMSNRFKALLAMLMSLFIVGATSAAAEAASTWSFTAPAPSSGYTKLSTSGTITFTGAKTFKYSASVTDHCPGDGKGGAIYFLLDGPDDTITNNVAVNRVGCGETVSQSGTVTRQKTIKRVQVRLCWTDNSDDCTIVSTTASTWKTNPYA